MPSVNIDALNITFMAIFWNPDEIMHRRSEFSRGQKMDRAFPASLAIGLLVLTYLPDTYAVDLFNNSIRSLAIDPDVPSTLIVGYTNGTVAISIDGGANWPDLFVSPTILGSSGDITELAIDPNSTIIISDDKKFLVV